jgi:O-antigen/teichoic acid export membrane protein
MLTTSVVMLIASIASGLVASFGNLLATESKPRVKEVLNSVSLFFLIMYAIAFCGLFVLSGSFLTLWLNEETVLPFAVVLLWSLNLFAWGYTIPLGELRFAAGVFEPDKYLHIFLAIFNLAISVILVQFLGIAGVILGTTICIALKHLIVLPHIVYKHVFKQKAFGYYKKMLLDFLLVAVCVVACYFVYEYLINTGLLIVDFLIGGVICVILPATVLAGVHAKTPAMKNLINTGKNLIKKKIGKGEKPNENHADKT